MLDAATGRTLRSLPGRPVAIGQGRAVLRTDGRLELFSLAAQDTPTRPAKSL